MLTEIDVKNRKACPLEPTVISYQYISLNVGLEVMLHR